MKPSPSPSSLSPSSYGSRGGRATSNCLSRILRRILCFSNLPLCSFDRFKADEGEGEVATGAPDATPGVVARLMGLDTVPPAEPVKESPSSGSADRLKTSRAREIPPYRELEDEKFFILSFERRHVSHTGKMKPNSRGIRPPEEGKNGRREKRRENMKGKNKENEDPSKKSRKKMSKMDFFAEAITSEYEGDSENSNSSPNSVLEFERFSTDQEFFSPGESSRLEKSKTRRPLSEELQSCEDPKGGVPTDGAGLVKSTKKQPDYGGKVGEIGRMAATEVMGSKWMHEEMLRKKHYLMEIGKDIASTIFDLLLEELVINFEQF